MLPLIAGAAAGLKFGTGIGALAGALTGVLTKRKDEDLLTSAAMGGLSGFGAANLASGLASAGGAELLPGAKSAATSQSAISNTLPNLDANYLAGDVAPLMTNTPIWQSGGLGYNMSGVAPTGGLDFTPSTFSERATAAGKGLKGLLSEGGWDAFKQGLNPGGDPVSNLSAASAIGMPVLSTATSMGAFDPYTPKEQEEDDEYSRLGGLYLYGPKSRDSGARFAGGGLAELKRTPRAEAGPYGYGLGRLSSLANANATSNAEVGVFQEGGLVAPSVPQLSDGGFVGPADFVNMVGNQNTEKGQAILAREFGAIPIKGPGDGYSDSIPTTIDGVQDALVANGEVYFPPEVVEAHGGVDAFYKLLDRVRKQATGSTKQIKPITG